MKAPLSRGFAVVSGPRRHGCIPGLTSLRSRSHGYLPLALAVSLRGPQRPMSGRDRLHRRLLRARRLEHEGRCAERLDPLPVRRHRRRRRTRVLPAAGARDRIASLARDRVEGRVAGAGPRSAPTRNLGWPAPEADACCVSGWPGGGEASSGRPVGRGVGLDPPALAFPRSGKERSAHG